jgi:predicted esterase YcpF (UPF0227 family)
MPSLIYLHGLGSNGQSSTASALRELGMQVSSPDYAPQHYAQSMEHLRELLTEVQPQLVVGTSMGGYYALKLAEEARCPALAINACFEPGRLLRNFLDAPAMDYTTGEPIPFTQAMLDAFASLDPGRIRARIVIGRNDDVIPPDYQRRYCERVGWPWHETDWGHRVDDPAALAAIITTYLDAVARAG